MTDSPEEGESQGLSNDQFGPLPDWLIEIFGGLLKEVNDLHELLTVSVRSISIVSRLNQVMESLVQAADAPDDLTASALQQATEDAARAQAQIDAGFPLLHAQAVVMLWGFVESAIRDFLAGWLERNDVAKQVSKVKNMRISFADYQRMDTQELCYYIVDTIDRELNLSQKVGVGRFESLLQVFDFSGSVEGEVKKGLVEIQNIRNTIVHRRGIADARLQANCPWLDIKVGESIVVTRDQFLKYSDIVGRYVGTVIGRVRTCLGLKPITADDLLGPPGQ